MVMYSFTNDYSEGCHPRVLELLTESNGEQLGGYGEDVYSQGVADELRRLSDCPDAGVFLIPGGTITNLLVLAAALRPFESAIATEWGHINTHEAGAIEATGHKVETVRTLDGKLRVGDIKPLLDKFPLYHTVRPRLVYISNSTEVGTVYTKAELTELSEFCRSSGLLLYMDGARLPSALMARSNDLTLADVARLTDVFYLGGTKCGALLGEALVITNDLLKVDFAYHIKQRGAMLAKGRVLGVQFAALLKDGLIFDLAAHANVMAMRVCDGLREAGVRFWTDSDTNQIFPILPRGVIESLAERYDFYVWKELDEGCSVIRLIMSWATPVGCVDAFVEDVRVLLKKK